MTHVIAVVKSSMTAYPEVDALPMVRSSPDGVAFTGGRRLVRKETGYYQEKLKPRYPKSGSRAARAELPAPIGAYR